MKTRKKEEIKIFIDENGIETIDLLWDKEKEIEEIKKETENFKLGYVYIIYNPSSRLYKIGSTKNHIERFKNMEFAIGTRVKRFYISKAIDNFRGIESLTHDKFSKYRQLGEWFRFSYKKANEAKKFIEYIIKKDVIS